MINKRARIILAILSAILGTGLILGDFVSFVKQIDNYNEVPHSFFAVHQSEIGLLLIILAPLIAKRYIWFFILLGLGAILTTWLYFAN